MLDVHLHAGREKSLRRRHPWVLSGAVREVGDAPAGAWSRVLSADGEVLGFGHLAPDSPIRVRMLAFGDGDGGAVDEADLVEKRIAKAVERRASDPTTQGLDGVRLVNAEGDGLPGLVADRYGEVVVVRFGGAGPARLRSLVADALAQATGAAKGYERADSVAARREGIAARQGELWGGDPPKLSPIVEHERRYEVDVVEGQKTGFYLDQRDARDLVEALASGRRMLDLYTYTGGFAVAAARGGASSVTAIDSSAAACERAKAHLELNAPGCEATAFRADVTEFLKADRSEFDLIVADPPPLARRKGDVPKAARAYKDLVLRCLRRAAPGAYLLVFSCSEHMSHDLFRKVVFGAALDAKRAPQVLRTLGAPSDHPVSIFHPEGEYLRGLLLRV